MSIALPNANCHHQEALLAAIASKWNKQIDSQGDKKKRVDVRSGVVTQGKFDPPVCSDILIGLQS